MLSTTGRFNFQGLSIGCEAKGDLVPIEFCLPLLDISDCLHANAKLLSNVSHGSTEFQLADDLPLLFYR